MMYQGMMTSAGLVRMPAILVTREDAAIPFTLTAKGQEARMSTADQRDQRLRAAQQAERIAHFRAVLGDGE